MGRLELTLERAEAFVAENYYRVENAYSHLDNLYSSCHQFLDTSRIHKIGRLASDLTPGLIGDPNNPNAFNGRVDSQDEYLNLVATEPLVYYGARAYVKTDLQIAFDESYAPASIVGSRQFHTPYHDVEYARHLYTDYFRVVHGRDLLPGVIKTLRLAKATQSR